MVLIQKLTPEAFLGLPRRGVIVPNENGTSGLYHVSTHEFGRGTKKEWRVMDLESGTSRQLSEDDKVHDVSWLPGSIDMVVWLQDAGEGVTQLVVADIDSPDVLFEVIAEFDGAVASLKLKGLDDGSIALAVVGLAGDKGGLFNEKKVQKKSTARIFDAGVVREWDTYRKDQKYAIFYSQLVRSDGGFKAAGPLFNLLAGTALEAPEGVYWPGGGAVSNYDLGPKGIVFVARDPAPPRPQYDTASDVYFVPLDSWTQPVVYKPTKLLLQNESTLGLAGNPRFSPDGTMIAYLKAPFSNLADTRLLMSHVSSLASFDVWRLVVGSSWELVPAAFEFAPSGESLFITADSCGRNGLYELELRHRAEPRLLARNPSVEGFHPLKSGQDDLQLLVSASSMVESSVYTVIDTKQKEQPRIVSSATRHGSKLDLSHSQVSEVWFEGSGNACVQAWVVKPRAFDETKKWPVVLSIHGGPESTQRDEWHWRWNLAVWAEQGYVVVAPNITGSLGFGVDFTSGVYGEWGGRPYQDLVNCVKYLAEIPYLDMDRMVAAGGSYGGYMINWILGQPLAQKFKALVCHDGIFDTKLMALHSDLLLGINDFNGPGFPWNNAENLEKWNPSRPELLRNWRHAPPTLVIHSEKDYRCAMTQGLATFRALQFLGVPSRLLMFPDENHWVLNPENSLVWHQTVFDWIEKWVGKGPTQETVGGEHS